MSKKPATPVVEQLPSVDGSFGINNRDDFPTPQYLRDAVNVDITRDKKKRRRQGLTRVYEGWPESLSGKDVSQDFLFFVEGTALKMATAGELQRHVTALRAGETSSLSVSTLRSDLQPGLRMAYTRGPSGWVYYSNGQVCGAINAVGELRDWAPETPSGQPTLTAVNGSLYAGRYKVAVTFVDVDGREGGTDEAAEIDLTNGKGIYMTEFPQPVSNLIVGYNIYVSKPNNAAMYLVTPVPVRLSQSAFFWVGGRTYRELRTQYCYPPQPGGIIEYHDGRFYSIVENVCQFSRKWLEVFDRDDVVIFPDEVRMFRALLDGIYASADRTYWLAGSGPQDWSWNVLSMNAAVAGTDVLVDSHDVDLEGPLSVCCLFTTDDGIMLGAPGGLLQNLTHNKVRFATGKVGAGLFRQLGPLKQYLATFESEAMTSGLSLGDRVIGTIVKGGG